MSIPPKKLSYYLAATTATMFLLVGFVRMQIGEVENGEIPGWFRWLWPLYVVPGIAFVLHLPRAVRSSLD